IRLSIIWAFVGANLLAFQNCGSGFESIPAGVFKSTASDVVILYSPTAKIGYTANSATLSVVAESRAGHNLTYQWRKDGQDLLGALNSNLTLNNLSALDAGQYSVLVMSTKVDNLGNFSVVSELESNGILLSVMP